MKKSIRSTADLALHLGLSRWTVSRAINGHSGVGPETASLVREAMLKFGFTPSAHARGLRGGRTKTVGICFRELDTIVMTQKLAHIQRLLTRRGYRPLFELTEIDEGQGLDVINHFISMRVDGVILVDGPPGSESETWLGLLKQSEIPAVLFEPRGEAAANAVQLDREEAMARVTEHLLALGHQQIGLLGVSREFPMGKRRYEGIVRALRNRGLAVEAALEIVDFPEHRFLGIRYGRELAAELLTRRKRPTALLALNDEVALGTMLYLQKQGFRFPEDLSLFGFDNLAVSEGTSPALCTVDHNVAVAAAAAVEMLAELMERGPLTRLPVRTIEPRLVFRDSVAAVSRPPTRKFESS